MSLTHFTRDMRAGAGRSRRDEETLDTQLWQREMANNNTDLKLQRLFGFHTSTPNLGETALSDLSHSLPFFFLVLPLLELLQKGKTKIYCVAVESKYFATAVLQYNGGNDPSFPQHSQSFVFLYNSLCLSQNVLFKEFHLSDELRWSEICSASNKLLNLFGSNIIHLLSVEIWIWNVRHCSDVWGFFYTWDALNWSRL